MTTTEHEHEHEHEHAADWDSQREKLSALLDGRLAPEEDAALRRHLQTCARCTQELAALRQVVALLHALPTPALPRSFTLPVAAPPVAAPRTMPRVTPLPLARRARSTSGWPRVAQWAGGLVAAAGLLIGVSGIFGAGHVQNASDFGPRAASSGAGSQRATNVPYHVPANATGQPATPSSAADQSGQDSGTPAATLAPIPSPTLQSATGTTGTRFPTQVSSGGMQLPDAPVIGGALLLAGAATFAAGTRSRRRQR